MNVYEALRNDHEKQRHLAKMLTDTSGESKGRQQIFAKLKNELAEHAKAEEKYFYSHLMEHEKTIEKARHSVAEHKELDDYIEELEQTDLSSPHFIAVAKKLEHRLNHHLDEEEQEVFQMSGKVLTEQEKSRLGTKIQEYRH
jgi:hypothetical protein